MEVDLEKVMSLACSAASGDETMIAGVLPSHNDMMGPYCLAKVWR